MDGFRRLEEGGLEGGLGRTPVWSIDHEKGGREEGIRCADK